MDLFKLSLDRLLLTGIVEVTDVGLEPVGEEVVAAAGSPSCVGDVVH